MKQADKERLLAAIANAAEAQCLSDKQLESLVVNGVFEALFHPRAEFSKKEILQTLNVYPERYHFIVNYGLTLDQMARAGNFYYPYYRAGMIGEWRCTLPEHEEAGAKRLRGEIFSFPTGTKPEDTAAIIAKAGMRHANIYELLAFAATFPDAQLHSQGIHGIIAFGTPLQGNYSNNPQEEVYLALRRMDLSTRCGVKDWRRTLGITGKRWFAEGSSAVDFLGVVEE